MQAKKDLDCRAKFDDFCKQKFDKRRMLISAVFEGHKCVCYSAELDGHYNSASGRLAFEIRATLHCCK